jgi:hypothetical protein
MVRIILLASLLLLLDGSAFAQQCQQTQCYWVQNVQYCSCVYSGPVEDRVPWTAVLDAWSPYRNPYLTPYYVPYTNPYR